MIPSSGAEVWRRLPSHELMLPEPEQIDDETGIGGFHDTFLIRDVPLQYAIDAVSYERQLIDAVDLVAKTEDEYELLVAWLESGVTDDRADLGDLADRVDPLDELIYYSESPLGWLEMGVAGLSYGIGALGGIPAASCRGHFGRDNAHRDNVPHVTFACEQELAQRMLDRCGEHDCGLDFVADLGFMQAWAADVRHLNRLAAALLVLEG